MNSFSIYIRSTYKNKIALSAFGIAIDVRIVHINSLGSGEACNAFKYINIFDLFVYFWVFLSVAKF